MIHYFDGITVVEHSLLPVDETTWVCDIKTREVVSVLTGRMIDNIFINRTLYASPELYTKIKSITNE